MKKLMTMIAAVAMSFGLFAGDTLNNSVSFATATNENPYATGDSLWAYTKDGETTDILKDEVQVKDHALVLETGSKVLSRKFKETEAAEIPADGALFADMTLDFNSEALEEIPEIDAGTKIAVFALDTSDWDAPTGEGEALPEQGTNIFVLASYGDPAQKALFMIKNFDGAALAVERTVALKAYKNVLAGDNARGGFLLYINHTGDTEITPVQVSAVYLFDEDDKIVWVDVIENGYLGRTDISGKLAKWTAAKSLFVSLDADPDTGASLASVDFSGRAKLSEITLTDSDEDNPWPADLVSMTLGLTDATITLTPASIAAGFAMVDGAITHPTGGSFSFTVTGDYDNFTVLNGTTPVPNEGGVYTTTLTDGGLLTVKSWEAAALVDGEPVETIEEAINAVNTATSACTLTLAGNVSTELTFQNKNFLVTLDLAGNTISVNSKNDAILNKGLLWITDTVGGGEIEQLSDKGTAVYNIGTLTIEKGIFTGVVYPEDGSSTTAIGGSFDVINNEKATVLTFIDQDNYELDEERKPGYYTVVPMANYVAQVGDKKFKTLAEAFAAAQANDTIVMLSDIVLSERIFVKNEKVTLDLAGKKIEWDATVANASGLLIVCRGADLTIDNSVGTGVIDAKDVAYAAIAVTHKDDPKNSQTDLAAKLTVNGGTLKGYYYAVVGNGGRPNTVITINDGYLVSTCTNDGAGIYHPQQGTLNLNGGTIEGYTGVYIKAGDTTCTVESEVTIIATGANVPYDPDRKGDGFIATGDALFVDNCGYPGGEPKVDVKGGTFQSTYGAAVASVAKTGYTPIAGFVEGGTFTGQVKIDDALAGGTYAFGPFEAGKPQTMVEAVAKINDVNYGTLDAAIAAAADYDIVDLLKDITLTATLDIAKPVSIDLNEKTITFAADLATGIYAHDADAFAIGNGKITVADGRQNIAGSKAIYLLRTSAAFENVEIDVPGFDYALTHMGNIADLGKNRSEYWTTEVPYTLDCDNVAVKGNGSLFHLEYVKADLDSNCTATQYTDKDYFSEAHQAAIYSSCGAVVTVNGGTYTAVNALQTGNLGGDIIVKAGEFTGNIKSWMLDNDTRDFANVNKANITIEGGKFTGNFVYAANCSEKSPLLTVVISGGDFSDTEIPEEFIEQKEGFTAKWVASERYTDYVTPAWEAIPQVPVAEVNGVEYTDLHEAMEAVTDGETLTLLCNVDLEGVDWVPVTGFKGTFDGQNFIISNLTINATANGAGFIGATAAAASGSGAHSYVKNVTFENATVNAGTYESVAVVMGTITAHSPCDFENVKVVDSSVTGKKWVGALFGNTDNGVQATNITVKDSTFTIPEGGSKKIGAIYGYCAGNSRFTSCTVTGNTITGPLDVGAVAGQQNQVATFDDLVVNQPGMALFGGLGTASDRITTITGENTSVTAASFCTTDEYFMKVTLTGGTYSFEPTDDIAVIADEFKVVDNDDDTWTVVAKAQVALTISAENATVTGIEAGTVLEGSNLTFKVAANTGYKLVDVKANGEELEADAQGNYTYEVTGEETEQALAIVVTVEEEAQPLDPEQPKHYETKEEAEKAAAEMNGEDGTVKPEYIKIPAAAGTSDEAKAAYAGLFKAVADADGNVTIQFTETAAAAIEDEITDAQANVIKPDAEGKAEIETKPGLFYGIAATAEVGTIKGTDPADWQQATGATLKLEVPTVEGTKAFFQIHCQAKNPQSNL